MILLDSYYESEENEVLFVKIRARFPDLWRDTSFGPKFPTFLGPRPQMLQLWGLKTFSCQAP